MKTIKRIDAEVQAAIDDMYFEMLEEWDMACCAASSTGENMVKESLGEDGYKAMCERLMTRVTMKIARRLKPTS